MPNVDVKLNLPPGPHCCDVLLQHLVSKLKGTDGEIAITLLVGGCLVSGMLVSEHVYLESFEKRIIGAFKGKADDIWEDTLTHLRSALAILTSKRDEEESPPEGKEQKPPFYVHLKDAKLLLPSGCPPQGAGTWWRVRIARIDGFCLGGLYEDAKSTLPPVKRENY